MLVDFWMMNIDTSNVWSGRGVGESSKVSMKEKRHVWE